MSVKIEIFSPQVGELIDPVEMIDNKFSYGTVFQQYSHGEPTKDFYINVGLNEKRVVQIWYNDENSEHRLSTDNKKDLRGFYPHIKVREIDAEIIIGLAT